MCIVLGQTLEIWPEAVSLRASELARRRLVCGCGVEDEALARSVLGSLPVYWPLCVLAPLVSSKSEIHSFHLSETEFSCWQAYFSSK